LLLPYDGLDDSKQRRIPTMFWKRIFNRKEKSAAQGPVGTAMRQSVEDEASTRTKMENELADARAKREAAEPPKTVQ